jgi:hypothetical protein
VPFGDSWQKVSQDAPWRRHTRLPLEGKGTYERVRMDHWLYDTKDHRTFGWFVLFLLVGTGTTASVILVRRTRSRVTQPDNPHKSFVAPG